MWEPNAIVLLFSVISGVVTPCFGKEAQISSPLASAICGQWAAYKETKVIQNSLRTLPTDIPLLTSCDTWLWNKCDKKGQRNCGKITQQTCSQTRIVGGTETTRPAEFPWDINIRFIYDWGSFYPEPRPSEDVIKNDFKGLKELHRCTGTIYSPYYVITSAWCGSRAKEYIHTKNRFVMWVARGKFLDAKLISHVVGEKPRGDIYIHPKFDPTIENNHNRDNDIAILKVPKPFKYSKEVYGLEIATENMTFEGTTAQFTGWGTTLANVTGSMLGHPENKPGFGSKLYKLDLTVTPWNGTCEEVVRSTLETDANYDPAEDLSKRYMCAKAHKKDEQARGACGGDIGGPLICADGDKKYLCGIRNSWAIVTDCPSKDNIEVFIRPSFYWTWIERVAGKQTKQDVSPK